MTVNTYIRPDDWVHLTPLQTRLNGLKQPGVKGKDFRCYFRKQRPYSDWLKKQVMMVVSGKTQKLKGMYVTFQLFKNILIDYLHCKTQEMDVIETLWAHRTQMPVSSASSSSSSSSSSCSTIKIDDNIMDEEEAEEEEVKSAAAVCCDHNNCDNDAEIDIDVDDIVLQCNEEEKAPITQNTAVVPVPLPTTMTPFTSMSTEQFMQCFTQIIEVRKQELQLLANQQDAKLVAFQQHLNNKLNVYSTKSKINNKRKAEQHDLLYGEHIQRKQGLSTVTRLQRLKLIHCDPLLQEIKNRFPSLDETAADAYKTTQDHFNEMIQQHDNDVDAALAIQTKRGGDEADKEYEDVAKTQVPFKFSYIQGRKNAELKTATSSSSSSSSSSVTSIPPFGDSGAQLDKLAQIMVHYTPPSLSNQCLSLVSEVLEKKLQEEKIAKQQEIIFKAETCENKLNIDKTLSKLNNHRLAEEHNWKRAEHKQLMQSREIIFRILASKANSEALSEKDMEKLFQEHMNIQEEYQPIAVAAATTSSSSSSSLSSLSSLLPSSSSSQQNNNKNKNKDKTLFDIVCQRSGFNDFDNNVKKTSSNTGKEPMKMRKRKGKKVHFNDDD